MRKKIKIFVVLSVLAGALLAAPLFPKLNVAFCPAVQMVKAESGLGNMDSTNQSVDERGLVPCTLTECTFCHLLKMIERIFFWLLAVAFAMAVLFVIVSGFAYILAIGDSSAMSWAKEGLKLTLMGFVICLLAWLAIHVLYTVLGYQGNWWTMECANDQQQSSTRNSTVANLYANEIAPDDLGGRNNPIVLPDLANQGLKNIPENKYFFVHGLGGQPLEQASEQIAKITREAKDQEKVVYAATPYTDLAGNPQGVKLTNLTNYIANDNNKTLENFSSLVVELVKENPSLESALIKVAKGETDISKFNEIWPQNPDFYEGKKATFETLSSMTNDGVLYKETGPVIINWPDGKIPKNFSNFSINVDYDEESGKYILNVNDPVDVTLPNNISPQAARAAARDFSKVLSSLENGKQTWNSEEDIVTELSSLLQKTDLSKELNSQGVDKGNDSGLYRDFIENENGNYVKSRDWESNGTGLLPSGIKTTTPTSSTVKWPQHTDSDKLDKATKDLEKELENWIRDDLNQKTASGNGVGGDQNQSTSTSGSSGDRTSSSGRTGTDTSGQESSTPISNSVVSGAAEDPNSMVSLVSVGINGPLNLEQRGKLRDLIINIQKEEMENVQDGSGQYKPLNIPPEYVMCLMQAESSMNPVATSPTGAAGLGQFTDDSQKEGAEMMKKMSPKHYEEFSKKYGKDLTQAMSTKASGSQNVKNTLRKDANLAAAMTYDFVQVKARNVLKLNGPVSMNDLQRITYRYIGDGNEGSQWNYIRKCMTNNGWAINPKKK